MATTSIIARLPVDYIDLPEYHDAVDRLKLLNRGSGFQIVIQRTKQDRTNLKATRKVFLQCDKSRIYKSKSTGQRKSSTRSTECPWRCSLTRVPERNGWHVEVLCAEHNHELEDSDPAPTLQRRQKPRPPPRALAALAAYQPETPSTTPGPSQQVSSAPVTMPAFHQAFPIPPGGFQPVMYQGPTQPTPGPPPVLPSFAQAYPASSDMNSAPPQTHGGVGPATLSSQLESAASQATGPQYQSKAHQNRRKGFSIISQIPRVSVPLSQRVVSNSRNPVTIDAPAFVIYNDSFNAILGSNPNLLIAYEDTFPFAHGAAVFSPHRDIVFVSSAQFVPAGRYEKTVMISRLNRKPDGSWIRSEILTLCVLTNSGTTYGDDGILFCTQGDYRDPGGLVHMEPDYPYRTTVMLNNYLGRRFNSVSDCVVHSDGSIWFTDPIYGFEQGQRAKPELPNQVYRFDPGTGDVRVVADGFGRPKGICFAPDERTVYITDTDAVHGDGSVDYTRASTIYAFDVEDKQNTKWLTNRHIFAMPDKGVPNAVKCDAAGNVYAACGDGLNIWNSAGVLLGKVLVHKGISGFCFGNSGELFLLNESIFWILTVSETVSGAGREQNEDVRPGASGDTGENREHAENGDDSDSMRSLF
ncbi:calcium-dependent phosphotriesterase [Lophiostoma macrostomum CBS 122681]|uniref:Calcium-dependent phosphotriesterase n=1 Tax=Lophiostoma macrostomum CBS 122681 TaxID=1314788 RepID=A0A6A6TP12_9PLEO|nr:calcium-dependent phosphotriesterase [Lophiostoma macrostomum CBS 122681]